MTDRNRAFTLIELLVVISITTLLMGILLPALGHARRAEQQAQNATQIRGIHAGMVIFAQGNDGWFPGRTPDAEAPTKQTVSVPATPQTGLYVQSRFRELLEDRYFTGEYINAPGDRRIAWTSGNVKLEHYSYAMLAMRAIFGAGAGTHNGLPPILDSQNALEWSETSNAEAIVISDRAVQNPDTDFIRSIHTNPVANTTDWRGHAGWNDGHATYENTHVLRTRHGMQLNPADDLFDDEYGNKNHNNAMMVFHHHGATRSNALSNTISVVPAFQTTAA